MAVREDRAVVLLVSEGNDEWNVTLPLHVAGTKTPVGAAGILFKKGAATDERDALAKSGIIRAELERSLPYRNREWR